MVKVISFIMCIIDLINYRVVNVIKVIIINKNVWINNIEFFFLCFFE